MFSSASCLDIPLHWICTYTRNYHSNSISKLKSLTTPHRNHVRQEDETESNWVRVVRGWKKKTKDRWHIVYLRLSLTTVPKQKGVDSLSPSTTQYQQQNKVTKLHSTILWAIQTTWGQAPLRREVVVTMWSNSYTLFQNDSYMLSQFPITTLHQQQPVTKQGRGLGSSGS